MNCRTIAILVNYKGAQDTAVCLRSLHASDIVPHIVVVDNTPYDPELPDVIAEYPDVHLISAPDNLGFGGGNNLGINWAMSQTDCEFIFIFNNDAIVEADTITKLESSLITILKLAWLRRVSYLWINQRCFGMAGAK